MVRNGLLSRVTVVVVAMTLAGCGSVPSPQSIANNLIGPCGPPVGYTDLAWSPDSSRIAFTLLAANGNEIAVMNANGGDLALISDPAGSSYTPQWSPDGKKLVFVTEIAPDQAAIDAGATVTRTIDIANADGSGQQSITLPGDFYMPSWSPDGTRIVFGLKQYGDMDIYLMDVDGANITRLTTAPGNDRWPVWSPDGKRIAFITDRTDQPGLYVINRDGTGETRLDSRLAAFPSWSPDGTMLAYVVPYQNTMGMYVILVKDPASPAEQLPLVAGDPSSPPGWFADGKSLLFDDWADGPVRVGVDGLGQTALSSVTGNDISPTLSPDGRSIAFLTYRNGNGTEIYMMDADGSNQRRITSNPANQNCLRWPF